jgi:hypothetical protein
MVARNDRTIPAAVERFMGRRANAMTVEIASSHAAPAAHPAQVADFILTVARAAAPWAVVTPRRVCVRHSVVPSGLAELRCNAHGGWLQRERRRDSGQVDGS